MNIFELVRLMDPRVTPRNSKVHLAGWNGTDDPFRVYLEGRFDDWQNWQTRKNFEREHVLSLIQLPERGRWLYAGVYASGGCEWLDEHKLHRYKLGALTSCAEFAGRLIVSFERPGRQSYLNGETCVEHMTMHQIRAEPMHLEEFPGFKKVDLEFPDLEVIVWQNTTSWRTVLSNVAGVYLISDADSGKLYVGSATGEGGIWSRWCQYVDGHGNNVELRKLVGELGKERARAFRFSILEIADVHASLEEVHARESHWKRILLSRSHGYNAN
jgi:hypothetical protein